MNYDLTNEELNIFSDVLEDSLCKLKQRGSKMVTSRHYRNSLRRLKEKVDCWLLIHDNHQN